jgi:hypothetical protein
VPPEVESNRIGYLAVQINQSFREATLLGFVVKVSTEELPISQLQSLERFHEYLEYLSQVKLAELASPSISSGKTMVSLSRWFENNFELGWQSIEVLLSTQLSNLALNLRSAPEAGVSRGKLIDLGIEQKGQAVVLLVSLTPLQEQKMDILVEVQPKNAQTYLPPNLQLIVLDNLGEAVMEAIARSANNYMQLQFSGSLGERFSVKVALEDVSVVENFVI